MSRSTRVTTLLGAALAAAALIGAPAANASTANSHGGDRGGAVFVETDGTSANKVVTYQRAADGSLHAAGTYETLGKGGVLDGSAVDHTASQGAVTYDPVQRLLYAVNAGSGTITVFRVDGTRLTRLQVIGSGGQFPVSVAVRGHVVYVLNARAGGSIQGYLSVGGRLVRVPSWQRPLGLDASATPEFTSTPGQVAFSPDGRKLLVTTKGNTNAVDVFGLGLLGKPGWSPTVNVLPGAVPFAMTFDGSGHLVLAEAGPSSVATFTIKSNGKLAAIDTKATGQAATCWVAAAGRFVYTGNAGSSSVSGYAASGRGALTALGNTTAGSGTVDLAASPDGRDLYVRSGGDGTVHAFSVGSNGALTAIGSVSAPDSVGGEGIAVS
jgi:6-phosphogluconolactonase (cycloisomerase 2 family)